MRDDRFFTVFRHFNAVAAMRDEIKARELALFSLLLNAWNASGRGERFEVSTSVLCFRLDQIDRKQLSRSRDVLRECGVLEFESGSRAQKATYFFPILGESCHAKRPAPVTPNEREKEKERAERDSTAADSALDLDSVISEVEEHYPKRADVRDVAERLMDKYPDRKITVRWLKDCVRDERHPKHKAQKAVEDSAEPEGWREKFAEAFPSAEVPENWYAFTKKFGRDKHVMDAVNSQAVT